MDSEQEVEVLKNRLTAAQKIIFELSADLLAEQTKWKLKQLVCSKCQLTGGRGGIGRQPRLLKRTREAQEERLSESEAFASSS